MVNSRKNEIKLNKTTQTSYFLNGSHVLSGSEVSQCSPSSALLYLSQGQAHNKYPGIYKHRGFIKQSRTGGAGRKKITPLTDNILYIFTSTPSCRACRDFTALQQHPERAGRFSCPSGAGRGVPGCAMGMSPPSARLCHGDVSSQCPAEHNPCPAGQRHGQSWLWELNRQRGRCIPHERGRILEEPASPSSGDRDVRGEGVPRVSPQLQLPASTTSSGKKWLGWALTPVCAEFKCQTLLISHRGRSTGLLWVTSTPPSPMGSE